MISQNSKRSGLAMRSGAGKTQKLISVIVIARDEEKNLPDCLKSIKWADEIIIVDSGSKDNTVNIARNFGARVVQQLTGGFSAIRNKGVKEAKGDWILYVDADERVSSSLRKEINSKIAKGRTAGLDSKSKFSAYAIPRKNIILGKEMRYGGWWPDYVKRLFLKKNFKQWTGELHEEPEFEGELEHLIQPFIHLKHDNLSDMVTKTNEWSEIEARLMFVANHPPMNFPRFVSAMAREFWTRIVKYNAFLDGPEGIIYAQYQVFSRFVSYAKLWELQIKNDYH